jgi:hypothetical protein
VTHLGLTQDPVYFHHEHTHTHIYTQKSIANNACHCLNEQNFEYRFKLITTNFQINREGTN